MRHAREHAGIGHHRKQHQNHNRFNNDKQGHWGSACRALNGVVRQLVKSWLRGGPGA
jgi:hypothetical protein